MTDLYDSIKYFSIPSTIADFLVKNNSNVPDTQELNEEGPSGLGGHGVEPYVVDSSGAIVLRCNVVHKERLSLSRCLLLMCSAFRISLLLPFSSIER